MSQKPTQAAPCPKPAQFPEALTWDVTAENQSRSCTPPASHAQDVSHRAALVVAAGTRQLHGLLFWMKWVSLGPKLGVTQPHRLLLRLVLGSGTVAEAQLTCAHPGFPLPAWLG